MEAKNKKIAFIISHRDFRDEEYFVPKEILDKKGIATKTVSTSIETAIGADGGEANVDMILENFSPDDFDGMIFVGGPGCLKEIDNEISYDLIRKALEKGKVIAAICIAPVIFAKSGILSGKRATVWSSSFDKSPIKILKEGGAIFQNSGVVSDGRIITAQSPSVAGEFGERIIRILLQ